MYNTALMLRMIMMLSMGIDMLFGGSREPQVDIRYVHKLKNELDKIELSKKQRKGKSPEEQIKLKVKIYTDIYGISPLQGINQKEMF